MSYLQLEAGIYTADNSHGHAFVESWLPEHHQKSKLTMNDYEIKHTSWDESKCGRIVCLCTKQQSNIEAMDSPWTS